MIRAIIFGASGYTGIELIRLLSAHPHVSIVAGSSRSMAGKTAGDMFPFVRAEQDFPLLSLEDLSSRPEADVAFLALPHGEAAPAARSMRKAGLKVIDLSADLRLDDAGVYEEWYGRHKDPDLLDDAVYGLPEINRRLITDATLTANPGCYPTTVILGTAPLYGIDEVDATRLIVDSKSGISGAGRGPKQVTSFCESGEGFKPYGVVRHRHIPEMEQELTKLAGRPIRVRFTPHLIPVSRGMVSDLYFPIDQGVTAADIRERYREYYKNEPFVRIIGPGAYPDTSLVKGSNQIHMAVEVDDRTGILIVMVAIDNLVKGASGTAVQNMNLMMKIEETAGLSGLPLFP